jgi:cell wall-associated NlpC family hydrolase
VRARALLGFNFMLFAVAGFLAPSAFAESTGGAGYQSPDTASENRSTAGTADAPAPAPGTTGAAAPAPVVAPLAQGAKAVLDRTTGLAQVPAAAPPQVQAAVQAANQIIGKPYRYGGGHRKGFIDQGYDCSGTVSFALNGGGLLKAPLDSSSFLRWGAAGPGTWITVYTNPGHAFAIIAGLRLDTSAAGDTGGLKGPRWRPVLRSTRGYKARHPLGL